MTSYFLSLPVKKRAGVCVICFDLSAFWGEKNKYDFLLYNHCLSQDWESLLEFRRLITQEPCALSQLPLAFDASVLIQ